MGLFETVVCPIPDITPCDYFIEIFVYNEPIRNNFRAKSKKKALFTRNICIFQKKVVPLQSCPIERTKTIKIRPL